MWHPDEKNFKRHVINNAAREFGLDEEETEALANKAGLTIRDSSDSASFIELLNSYKGRINTLVIGSNVTKRMLEYIRNGRIPTKETII